jgi:hypothetical protein
MPGVSVAGTRADHHERWSGASLGLCNNRDAPRHEQGGPGGKYFTTEAHGEKTWAISGQGKGSHKERSEAKIASETPMENVLPLLLHIPRLTLVGFPEEYAKFLAVAVPWVMSGTGASHLLIPLTI